MEEKEKQKKEGIHKRRRKTRGYKKMEWWKRCKDLTNKFFKREEEDRQGKEERKTRERKRKTEWSGWSMQNGYSC